MCTSRESKTLRSHDSTGDSWRLNKLATLCISISPTTSQPTMGQTENTEIKQKLKGICVNNALIATLLLPLRWDMGKVRDRFGGMGRFKGG